MAVLAVDAGGTRIKLGVVEGGKIISRAILDARSNEGLAPQLPRIAAALRDIAPSRVEGLGMAFPSLVDTRTGRVTRNSGKYRDAMDLDLNAWVQSEFGVPFKIENDARMAAIGEWRYGAGRGSDDIVMMTLGTGIGTGVVMGGKVLRGRHGQAGCLGGHTIVNIGGRRCPCGGIGCAEAEASTAVLPLLAAEDPDYAQSHLRFEKHLDYAAVYQGFISGDLCAVRIWDRSVNVWAAVSLSLIHAFDPEVLIIGGGIVASGDALLEPIRQSIQENSWHPWGNVRVVTSELGDDAAIVACEWLVRSGIEGENEIAFI